MTVRLPVTAMALPGTLRLGSRERPVTGKLAATPEVSDAASPSLADARESRIRFGVSGRNVAPLVFPTK